MNEYASPDDKLHLVECLYAIATADDLVSVVEDDQIAAVGRALMLPRAPMLEIRARHRDRLEVVQAARRLQKR
jgi:archaeosine-15-forming tRNA-guanine transglycosylase